MYTRYDRRLFSRGILQGLADLFWHHCISQPKAIRNRLKLVEINLEEGEKELGILVKEMLESLIYIIFSNG